jgi:hypothetical protein
MNHPLGSWTWTTTGSLTTPLRDLIIYRQLLQPEQYFAYRRISSTQTADRVIEHIVERSFKEDDVIKISWLSVTGIQIADLSELIRTTVSAREDCTLLSLVSTVITPRRKLVRIIKYNNGNYFIIVSGDLPDLHLTMAQVIVAVMLEEKKLPNYLMPEFLQSLQNMHHPNLAGVKEDIDAYMYNLTNAQRLSQMRTVLESSLLKPVDYTSLINDLYNKIENLVDRLKGFRQEVKRYIQQQFAQEHGIGEETPQSEALDYLMKHKHQDIYNIYIEDDTLYCTLRGTLYFSEDADTYIGTAKANSRSYLYGNENEIAFIESIADKTVRVPIFASFSIRTYLQSVRDINGFDLLVSADYPLPAGALANQHITHFNCFSSSKEYAYNSATRGDWIGFFEMLFNTTGSVNLYDSTVMSRFIPNLIRLPQSYPLQHKTDAGWAPITKGEYYALLQARREDALRADARRTEENTQGSEDHNDIVGHPNETDITDDTEEDPPF